MPLTLRKTIIGGEAAPDDYQVFFGDLAVGRILKQPGVPHGRPNWWWGVNFPGRPQAAGHKGICRDLEECKGRFKMVWAGIERGLTEHDIAYAMAPSVRPPIRPSTVPTSV